MTEDDDGDGVKKLFWKQMADDVREIRNNMVSQLQWNESQLHTNDRMEKTETVLKEHTLKIGAMEDEMRANTEFRIKESGFRVWLNRGLLAALFTVGASFGAAYVQAHWVNSPSIVNSAPTVINAPKAQTINTSRTHYDAPR